MRLKVARLVSPAGAAEVVFSCNTMYDEYPEAAKEALSAENAATLKLAVPGSDVGMAEIALLKPDVGVA